MKKYCLINNLYPPEIRGGAEKIVQLIAEELSTQGEVLVITSTAGDERLEQPSVSLKIQRLKPDNIYHLLDDNKQSLKRKLVWHFNNLFSIKLNYKVAKLLNDFQPDLVFTHNLSGLGFRIAEVIKKQKFFHIHTLHDYQLLEPHGSFFRNGANKNLNNLFYSLYRLIVRKIINNPDLVISPSQYVLAKHREYGFFKKSQSSVLPNPVVLTENFVKNQSNDSLNFLYLGQIEAHKGVELLVRAFQGIKLNVSLNIVGNGSQLDYLKHAYAKTPGLSFLGALHGEDLDKVMSQTDLLVLPSVWQENSPTVIYEAFARKIPVLVSDSGGSKELINENTTGFIFKSGSLEDLKIKLHEAFKHKTELNEMGEKGFEFISQFEVKKYIAKLLDPPSRSASADEKSW